LYFAEKKKKKKKKKIFFFFKLGVKKGFRRLKKKLGSGKRRQGRRWS